VTRARSKPHNTPSSGCVKSRFLYRDKCGIQWDKFSQMQVWTQLSLSRQWLVRVANHTLLLIRGVSQFSTNIKWVNWTITVAPLSTTESFSAVTRARSKSHTTPNTGCAQTLYKCEISETNPDSRTVELHRKLWSLVRVVVKHTLLLTRGVSRFSTDVRFSDLNLPRRTFAIFTITESFSAVTRVRNKSHSTPDTGVTKFSTNER